MPFNFRTIKTKMGRMVILVPLVILWGFPGSPVGAGEKIDRFVTMGVIQTLFHDTRASFLFYNRPLVKSYHIVERGLIVGTAFIEEIVPNNSKKYPFRAQGTWTVSPSFNQTVITAGMILALDRAQVTPFVSQDRFPVEERRYRQRLISSRDNRDMVLVPAGYVVTGSDDGRDDEKYGERMHLKAFYIDVFEVSNADYYRFMTDTVGRPPLSWERGEYNHAAADLPVLVTWHEADAYARWAGKRLPTDAEWEKAARGGEKEDQRMYPVGDELEPSACNYADTWRDADARAVMKKKYDRESPGLLPVTAFQDTCGSPCGAVNMAGNAPEWTSTWYNSYNAAKSRYAKRPNSRFGTLYKVIRGGGWQSDRFDLRVSSRRPGGYPSLRSDASAGFRCVRDVKPDDQLP